MTYRSGVARRKAGERDAVPGGDTGLAAKLPRRSAHRRNRGVVARHQEQGAERRTAARNRGLIEAAGYQAIEAEILGKDQAAIAANAPAVDDAALMHGFAHGGAPEHDRLGHEDLRAQGE